MYLKLFFENKNGKIRSGKSILKMIYIYMEKKYLLLENGKYFFLYLYPI